MSKKKFRVTFEIVMDSKKYHKDAFKSIATEERLKFDLEGSLE